MPLPWPSCSWFWGPVRAPLLRIRKSEHGYAPDKTIQDYENGGNTSNGDFDYGKIDLRVGVWLDRESSEIYQRGEEMGAAFQTNQDAYAVVYRIDVDGSGHGPVAPQPHGRRFCFRGTRVPSAGVRGSAS